MNSNLIDRLNIPTSDRITVIANCFGGIKKTDHPEFDVTKWEKWTNQKQKPKDKKREREIFCYGNKKYSYPTDYIIFVTRYVILFHPYLNYYIFFSLCWSCSSCCSCYFFRSFIVSLAHQEFFIQNIQYAYTMLIAYEQRSNKNSSAQIHKPSSSQFHNHHRAVSFKSSISISNVYFVPQTFNTEHRMPNV